MEKEQTFANPAAVQDSMKSKLRSRVPQASSMDVDHTAKNRTKIGQALAKAYKQALDRKRLLVVPQDIKDAHPDKEFAFIDRAEFLEQGGHNSRGWKPFKTDSDSESITKHGFGASMDNYVNRHMSILAWKDKEEVEQERIGEALIRQHRDLASVYYGNSDLRQANVVAEVHSEQVTIDNELIDKYLASAKPNKE